MLCSAASIGSNLKQCETQFGKGSVLVFLEIVIDEDYDDDDPCEAVRTRAVRLRRGGRGRAAGQAVAGRTHHAGQGGWSRCE